MVTGAPPYRLVGSWTESQVVDAVPWWLGSRAEWLIPEESAELREKVGMCLEVSLCSGASSADRVPDLVLPVEGITRRSELVSSVPLCYLMDPNLF